MAIANKREVYEQTFMASCPSTAWCIPVNNPRDLYTFSVDGLSVDWVNGKLYWTDATLKHIEVYDMQTGIRKVLIRTGNTTSPRAIVVDPATR